MKKHTRGFTLIELLIAISIMALMALLSWRGLDGMTRTQGSLAQRADEVLTLQAGLNQWTTDLNAIVQLPQMQSLEWDGRALRMTRRSAALPAPSSSASPTAFPAADSPPAEGILVVAWARREVGGGGQWLRWQSPPLKTRGDVQAAWVVAAQWRKTPAMTRKSAKCGSGR